MNAQQLPMIAISKEIERAVVHPEKRQLFLYRALTQYMTFIAAQGIGLIYPSINPYDEKSIHWLYVGTNQNIIEKMFKDRVGGTFKETLMNLENIHLIFPDQFVDVKSFDKGILIVWLDRDSSVKVLEHDIFIDNIETLVEVAEKEVEYFHSPTNPFDTELTELLQNKDPSGLSELLKLAQKISGGEILFWGNVNHNHIEITSHIGSKRPGFGFELPIGKGVGGQAAVNQQLVYVEDYKNSELRYKEVVDAVDSEDIRTGLAIPVKDEKQQTGGVFYSTRRIVKPFSRSTKLLLYRIGSAIEPLSNKIELPRLYFVNKYSDFISAEKSKLRTMMEQSRNIKDLEDWLSEIVKGQAVIVDKKGNSYTGKKYSREIEPLEFPLSRKGTADRGKLLLWSNIVLPLHMWDDFIEDTITAIYLILEREERISYLIEREYSQWLNALIFHTDDNAALYDKGIKLGLPVEHGEIWMIYWHEDSFRFTQRDKVQLEDIVLRLTKKPLIFHDNIGFVFMNSETWPTSPDTLRNELLKVISKPTWLVHSAHYQTFVTLKVQLERLVKLARQLPMTNEQQFVVTFNQYGLNFLLKNPEVNPHLIDFALNAFQALIEYDRIHGTELVKTLALSLVYPSPSDVAKKLFIHTNTVHYRVRKAKEILNVDFKELGNDIAIRLAAYTLLFNDTDFIM